MKRLILATTALLLILGVAVPAKAQGREEQYYPDRNQNDRDYNDRNDNYSSDNNNSQDNYDAINKVFRDLLGHNADRSGLRFYSRRMDAGWSIDKVRDHLAYSPQVQQAINQIYQQELGRNADPDGLDMYSRRLGKDWTLRQVRKEIANSKEARNRRH